MSREIKFRAWGHLPDTDDYQMFHDVLLYQFHGVLMPAVNEFDNPVCDHNLMQYTGLKDKNGVEIYEGDIITVANETSTNPRRGEVVWHDDQSCFYIQSKPYDYFHPLASWIEIVKATGVEVEVIGNIYEHPELLIKG